MHIQRYSMSRTSHFLTQKLPRLYQKTNRSRREPRTIFGHRAPFRIRMWRTKDRNIGLGDREGYTDQQNDAEIQRALQGHRWQTETGTVRRRTKRHASLYCIRRRKRTKKRTMRIHVHGHRYE